MARLLETLNPIEALVHETLNGEYELTFTTTARDVNKFDLLSAHTPNGRQLFRVAGVTNHADKSEIFARHVFFDLSGNFSLGFESKDVTCQTMINKFVSSLTEPLAPFALSTDITARNSYNPEEANALEILSHGKRSIVGVNDAELLRDNYAVKLQKRLGSDTNVLIHPRNNILDLKREYSSDDICTKIFLRGGTEEAPLEATITSPLIDKYPVVYARRYQNETDSITTVEQLIAWGKLHFDTDRIDVPKLSFDFDVFGDLGLQLGDSALVRVPELDVDVRSRVTGYDYDPMTQKHVKLYFGDKSTGLAGFIGDTTTGIVDEAVKNVDEKLQAEIDNANEAIQKEYEARVESVNDAIAKAEADAALVKSELQGELSQAVKDWEFDFEDAKTQINASIGNVSKELGEYIKSTDEIIAEHDDLLADASAAIGNMNTEIGNAKNDISDLFESTEANQGAIVTVSNNLGTLSTKVSNVETTANTANATASEVKQTASGLTSSVSSLQGTVDEVTGDITNMKSDITSVTQTASGLTSKVESLESDNVTNKQNISSVTQTADGLKSDVSSVTTTANTALAKATTVEQTASGLSSKVTSLETSDSTQNSNISQLQQTASGLTSTVSSHTSSINGLDSTVSTHTSEIKQLSDVVAITVTDGVTASGIKLTKDALDVVAKDINLTGNVQFGSLVEGDGTSTEILGGKIKTNTIKTSTLVVDKEILVDGTIKAVHLDGGTANIAEITSLVMSTEALNAAWANIGNAIIDKLTSDEALFQRLTAKTAWITSANIVSLDASKTTTGMLKSQNGRVVFDLNNAVLYANASTGNKYIQIDQDGVKLHNPSSTSAAQWGQLYAQNNRFTIRSRGDSRGLSLGYDLNDSYQECAFFSATSGNVQFLKQVQFNTEGHFKGGYNRFGQEGQGYFEIWGNSGAHKINPNAGNTGSLGDGTRYFNSSWVANRNNPSSLEFKNVSHYLDDSESLNLVKNVGVARYFYKGDEFVSKNSQTGLIYEDVRDQPQRDLLTNEEDKAINIYNMNSVLWSAVRALNENLNAEIVSLRAENEALRTDVTTLRDEIALERSERETLRAELNALTDLIAGKATVKVRT